LTCNNIVDLLRRFSDSQTQRVAVVLPRDHPYHFLVHDRDAIFSGLVDQQVSNLGVRILRTPIRAPMANACMDGSAAASGASVWTSQNTVKFAVQIHCRHRPDRPR
jgi:hypothetical protein